MEYDILNELLCLSVGSMFPKNIPAGMSLQMISPVIGNKGFAKNPTSTSTSVKYKENTTSMEFESKTSTKDDNLYKSLDLKRGSTGLSLKPSSSVDSSTSARSISNTSASSFSSLNTSGNLPSREDPRPNGMSNTSINAGEPLNLESWIKKEGPLRLQESLNKLRLDINKISKKDLDAMSPEDLTSEKKSVKNELKNYDTAFQNIFKRFPERAEKEPMRPLYIYYKKLKQTLNKMSKGDDSHKSSKDSNSIPSGKPNTVTMGNKEKENLANNFDKKDKSFDKSGKEPILNNFMNPNLATNGSLKSMSISKTGSGNSQGQLSQDQLKRTLDDLKNKRSVLREKLHNYQIEFTKNHNRKIRYHKDIEPVEEEYRKYKEIKSEIARIEELLH